MRILVIEDDKVLGDGIVQSLYMDDYVVDWVEDAETAKEIVQANDFGIVVLDVNLPDGSGFDVLKMLRAANSDVPILIVTADDDVSLRIKGLDSGADDYLVKPFKLDELKARIRALRRRVCNRATPMLEIGDVALDPAAKAVTKGGEIVRVSPREFTILHILMENKGKVLTKVQIEENLYGWDTEIESNTIEVHIHGLRKKLGKTFIETLRYVGYRVGGS